MNNSEKRWRSTGLLEGFDGYDAEALSEILDEGGNFLLQQPVTDKLQFIAGIILPVIVVLFRERRIRSVDVEHLYRKLNEALEEVGKMTDEEEEKFCNDFTQNYSPFE
jgi:hypothetical protein